MDEPLTTDPKSIGIRSRNLACKTRLYFLHILSNDILPCRDVEDYPLAPMLTLQLCLDCYIILTHF